MASKVDLSLDDIIVKNKISTRGNRGGRGRGRGQRRGGGQGAPRGRGVSRGRGGLRSPFNRTPRGGSSINGRWSHDMYYGGASAGSARPVSTGPTKLNITNLDYGVSDSDIKELFSEFGAMKNASVHYDRTGRSLGTAHVIFDRRGDALKAIKQYNGVHLDGRPMNIEVDGGSGGGIVPGRPGSVRGRVSSMNGVGGGRNTKRLQGGPRPVGGSFAGGRGRGSSRGRGGVRGGGRRGRGGRMGRGARRKVPTADELDAELDAYTFQASK